MVSYNTGVALSFILVALAATRGCKNGANESGSSQNPTSPAPQPMRDHAFDSGYVPNVNDDFKIDPEEKLALLQLARSSVEGHVKNGAAPPIPSELASRWPHLSTPRACFVTLRKAGDLRGCIGSLEPRRPLLDDVRQNSVAAAVNDSRFRAVTADELALIEYEISILDRPRPLQGVTPAELPAWLGNNKPGLIIEFRGRRSTFLPSVWDDLPDPHDFLAHLCRKQGSPGDCWRDPSAKLSIYGSIKIAEKQKD
jgi:AmmeMemoRadiSam system protein A